MSRSQAGPAGVGHCALVLGMWVPGRAGCRQAVGTEQQQDSHNVSGHSDAQREGPQVHLVVCLFNLLIVCV